MDDVIIKKSKIGQFGKGVFANRDFKKGEIVIRYNNLKPLTEKTVEKSSELLNSYKQINLQYTHANKKPFT